MARLWHFIPCRPSSQRSGFDAAAPTLIGSLFAALPAGYRRISSRAIERLCRRRALAASRAEGPPAALLDRHAAAEYDFAHFAVRPRHFRCRRRVRSRCQNASARRRAIMPPPARRRCRRHCRCRLPASLQNAVCAADGGRRWRGFCHEQSSQCRHFNVVFLVANENLKKILLRASRRFHSRVSFMRVL